MGKDELLENQAEELAEAAMKIPPKEKKEEPVIDKPLEDMTDKEVIDKLAKTVQTAPEKGKEVMKGKTVAKAMKKAVSKKKKVSEDKCECAGPDEGCCVCDRLPGDPWNSKCNWKLPVGHPNPDVVGNNQKVNELLKSTTVLRAFRDWRDGKAYIDGQGNYHLRTKDSKKGPNAPWNKEIKKAFPTYAEFQAAYKKASKRGLLKKVTIGKGAKKGTTDALEILHKRYANTPARRKALDKERELDSKKRKKNEEKAKEGKKLLRRKKPIKESLMEKEVFKRLHRRNKEEDQAEQRIPTEGKYVKNFSEDDRTVAIGKSISVEVVQEMYEAGLKAIQNHITNICPKIYIVDVLLPRHRVPKSRYLIEEMSPERALTHIRNENEKRIRQKKKLLFQEDDVIKLLLPTFESRMMEV